MSDYHGASWDLAKILDDGSLNPNAVHEANAILRALEGYDWQIISGDEYGHMAMGDDW